MLLWVPNVDDTKSDIAHCLCPTTLRVKLNVDGALYSNGDQLIIPTFVGPSEQASNKTPLANCVLRFIDNAWRLESTRRIEQGTQIMWSYELTAIAQTYAMSALYVTPSLDGERGLYTNISLSPGKVCTAFDKRFETQLISSDGDVSMRAFSFDTRYGVPTRPFVASIMTYNVSWGTLLDDTNSSEAAHVHACRRSTPPYPTATSNAKVGKSQTQPSRCVLGIVNAIAAHSPDIICLQEYVPSNKHLQEALADYTVHVSKKGLETAAIAVHTLRCGYSQIVYEANIGPMTDSRMGLIVEIVELRAVVVNVHLPHGSERSAVLESFLLKAGASLNESSQFDVVLLAGDFNGTIDCGGFKFRNKSQKFFIHRPANQPKTCCEGTGSPLREGDMIMSSSESVHNVTNVHVDASDHHPVHAFVRLRRLQDITATATGDVDALDAFRGLAALARQARGDRSPNCEWSSDERFLVCTHAVQRGAELVVSCHKGGQRDIVVGEEGVATNDGYYRFGAIYRRHGESLASSYMATRSGMVMLLNSDALSHERDTVRWKDVTESFDYHPPTHALLAQVTRAYSEMVTDEEFERFLKHVKRSSHVYADWPCPPGQGYQWGEDGVSLHERFLDCGSVYVYKAPPVYVARCTDSAKRGQNGLFAMGHLEKGTALGAFTGFLLTEAQVDRWYAEGRVTRHWKCEMDDYSLSALGWNDATRDRTADDVGIYPGWPESQPERWRGLSLRLGKSSLFFPMGQINDAFYSLSQSLKLLNYALCDDSKKAFAKHIIANCARDMTTDPQDTALTLHISTHKNSDVTAAIAILKKLTNATTHFSNETVEVPVCGISMNTECPCTSNLIRMNILLSKSFAEQQQQEIANAIHTGVRTLMTAHKIDVSVTVYFDASWSVRHAYDTAPPNVVWQFLSDCRRPPSQALLDWKAKLSVIDCEETVRERNQRVDPLEYSRFQTVFTISDIAPHVELLAIYTGEFLRRMHNSFSDESGNVKRMTLSENDEFYWFKSKPADIDLIYEPCVEFRRWYLNNLYEKITQALTICDKFEYNNSEDVDRSGDIQSPRLQYTGFLMHFTSDYA